MSSQPPSEPHLPESNEDKIQSFLNAFISAAKDQLVQDGAQTKLAHTPFAWNDPTQEISRYKLSDYNAVRTSDSDDERIKRLKRIISTIEKQTSKPTAPAKLPPNLKIDYQNALNQEQFWAATTLQGPVMALAGAGSGKTRTIIYRLSYMLEIGISPSAILLLTFTRKASQEMVHRAAALLANPNAGGIMATTYHGFANTVLRQYAPMIGLPANFTIMDAQDAEDLVDLIRNELKLNKQEKAFPKKERIAEIISKSRNCNTTIPLVIEREFKGLTDFVKDIELIAETYKRYKLANRTLDYDDLMDLLRDALRDCLPFRQALQDQYQYLMIDEFQDTNIVQKQIIDLLAHQSRNIMVVGDDMQSIYAFRGANFENILTFPDTYPDCKIIRLEQNYRSTQDILRFTNAIANSALLGYKKQMRSDLDAQFAPLVARFNDQNAEAEFIVDRILALRERGIPLNQIAVLYRSSFHGNYIQAELLKRNIPYVVVGGIKFVERRQVKDVLAFLRLALNPVDAVCWNRILKLIPGVGAVTTRKIIAAIQDNKGSIDFEQFQKNKFGTELQKLAIMLQFIMQPTVPLPTKIDAIKQYYTPILKLLEPDYELRLQDIDVLYDVACNYNELEKFLTDFALDPPSNKFQNQVRPLIDESEDKPLTLSTIHSSKGLEWFAVFVPHLLDGLFPSTRSMKNVEQFEEERRLFYVACTRTKHQLFLTMPSFVAQWDSYYTMPSRFLIEIDKKSYRLWNKKEEI